MQGPTLPWCVLSLLGLMLVGCAHNVVFFHETTKFALAVDYKPDSSQPASLTLGYKRQIVAVVPPQEPVSQADANNPGAVHHGEALSLVSTFDVEGAGTSGVTIKTFFASGMAAREMTRDPTRAPEAIHALFAPASFTPMSPDLQKRTQVLSQECVKAVQEPQAQQILEAAGRTRVPGKNALDSLRDYLLRARDDASIKELENACQSVVKK